MIDAKDFAVLLPDELFLSDSKDCATLNQMLSLYNKNQQSIVAVQSVNRKLTSRYGIVNLVQEKNFEFEIVKSAIEKPKASENNSNIAMVGRYIFKHSAIEIIRKLTNAEKESNLSKVILQLCQKETVLAYRTVDKRYDCSLDSDYLLAILNIAYDSKHLKQTVVNYAKEITEL